MNINAQEKPQHYFYKDVSYEFGIYTTANSNFFLPPLKGQMHSISIANYYTKQLGFRTGVNYVIFNTDAKLSQYSVPLYMTYKTRLGWLPPTEINIFELEQFAFQLLLGLLPRNIEFYLGTNLGAIDSNRSKTLDIMQPKAMYDKFVVSNSFLATIDAGMQMKYQINRVGITLHPAISYHLNKNYTFKMIDHKHANNNFQPHWFFRGTIGLSYLF